MNSNMHTDNNDDMYILNNEKLCIKFLDTRQRIPNFCREFFAELCKFLDTRQRIPNFMQSSSKKL
jgi:hypothetical protein